MRDYARIAPTFWTRGTGKKLRGDKPSQILAFYLMSAPAGGITGVFYLSMATVINDTGLTECEVDAGFARLSREQFAAYDKREEIVWVPGLARHQVGETIGGPKDKRYSGFVRELRQTSSHPFAVECYLTYRDAFWLPDGVVDASVGRWSWGLSTPIPCKAGELDARVNRNNAPRPDDDAHRSEIDAHTCASISDSNKGLEGSDPDPSRPPEDHPLLQAHVQAHVQAKGGGGDADEPRPPAIQLSPHSVGKPVGSRDSAASKKTRKDSARGARMPTDWQPSVSVVAWARSNRVDCAKHVDEFRDFWLAMPERSGLKADWDATFRNRIRDLIRLGIAAEYVETTPVTLFDIPVITEESRQSALELANQLEDFERKRVIRG